MDFINEAKHEALTTIAATRNGADANAVETLLALQDAVSQINDGLESFLSDYGLSQGRFYVLLLLLHYCEDNCGLLPSVLADKLSVSRATITGLLDGLERDGLVKRERDRSDKRTTSVRLTPVARGVMEGVLNEYYRRVGKWLGTVSGGGRRTLVGVLETILERIHAPENEPLPL